MSSTIAGPSTIAGSPPEALDEIKALFSWNPPPLIPAPNKKPSTATCAPSVYDKHLKKKLVLKRVVRLPTLVQDLAKNVDTALDAALATLPPLAGFITAEIRADLLENLNTVVTDEKAVTNFYDKTTASYCTPVASTLALHPTAPFSRWRSLLFWTQSGPSSSYAIMDGQLCFMEERVDEIEKTQQAAIVDSMEPKIRRIFEELRESGLPLGMKSISAGSVEVMVAVPELGDFSWTTCIAPNCSSISKHVRAKENVLRAVVGPDAQAPPWSFPNGASNTSLVTGSRDEEIDAQPLAPIVASSATPQRPVTRQVTRLAAGSGPPTLPPAQPSASRPSNHRSRSKDKGKKRQQDDDEEEEAYQYRPNMSRTKDKGKKRRRDDDEEKEEEEKAYQDRHGISAQSLVQQAWAQAVRVDGTVIVLHSGNHELVCLRHRASQTLYVSDVIEPSTCVDPGYGKLHVGIYIAAIQDTVDRLSQLKPPGDLIAGDKAQDDQDHNRGSGSRRKDGRGHRKGRGGKKRGGFQGSAGRKDPQDGELVAIEKTIDVASNRAVVLLYLQYDVYDSPVPASFLRSAPSIMTDTRCPTPPLSPRAIRTYGLEECLTIILTSEVGRGATGVVHRGTLEPEIMEGAMPLDVVVKLAFDSGQRDALRSEYEVYRRLRSKGVRRGIATALGFFDDSEGGACALVMLYAGVPLSTESQCNLSISDRESALSTLKSIHRAGILHGDIRRDNILIGDLGVTIIDFGHSEKCDGQRAKDKELSRLCYFLGLASGSH